jgi:hypothetical protein
MGGAGANAVANTGGAGGTGISSSISGSSLFYCGGGGGGNGGAGGSGVGGNGGSGATNGLTNRGGGGGANAQGGSGVVILSFDTTKYSGTYTSSNIAVTTAGGNTVMSYYSTGTYTA